MARKEVEVVVKARDQSAAGLSAAENSFRNWMRSLNRQMGRGSPINLLFASLRGAGAMAAIGAAAHYARQLADAAREAALGFAEGRTNAAELVTELVKATPLIGTTFSVGWNLGEALRDVAASVAKLIGTSDETVRMLAGPELRRALDEYGEKLREKIALAEDAFYEAHRKIRDAIAELRVEEEEAALGTYGRFARERARLGKQEAAIRRLPVEAVQRSIELGQPLAPGRLEELVREAEEARTLSAQARARIDREEAEFRQKALTEIETAFAAWHRELTARLKMTEAHTQAAKTLLNELLRYEQEYHDSLERLARWRDQWIEHGVAADEALARYNEGVRLAAEALARLTTEARREYERQETERRERLIEPLRERILRLMGDEVRLRELERQAKWGPLLEQLAPGEPERYWIGRMAELEAMLDEAELAAQRLARAHRGPVEAIQPSRYYRGLAQQYDPQLQEARKTNQQLERLASELEELVRMADRLRNYQVTFAVVNSLN